MIDNADKEYIKGLLGHRYVKSISDFLKEKNILNRNGGYYSNSQITNVMNGVYHHVIEKAIFEVVKMKKEELEKRKQLLRDVKKLNKKSVAATTDS
tara:strand:+ start:258 stop:545 length:288 start_codon:yes stop_codon:yes gene_type:complete